MKGEGGSLLWRVILLPLAFEALRHQCTNGRKSSYGHGPRRQQAGGR